MADIPNTEVEPVGNEGYITEMDIRLFLRDVDPTLNELLGDFEFSHEEIRTARTFAIDKFNDTPPDVITFEVTTFPWRYYLLLGTCSNLLFIAANRYRRNDLSYNIPGGAVNDQDKWKSYEAASARLYADYAQWINHKKRELNMQLGWGWK